MNIKLILITFALSAPLLQGALIVEKLLSIGGGVSSATPIIFPGQVTIGFGPHYPNSPTNAPYLINLGIYTPQDVGVERIIDGTFQNFTAIKGLFEDNIIDFRTFGLSTEGGAGVSTSEWWIFDQSIPRNISSIGFIVDGLSNTPSNVYPNFYDYQLSARFRFYGTGAASTADPNAETPEPSAWSLLLVSASVLAFQRKRIA